MKSTTSTISNPINDSLLRCALICIPLLLMCVILLPGAQAVSPAPDGGYPGGNTAKGQNALLGLTTGTFNTAIGLFSLRSLTDGSFNTGVGAGTLLSNTADQNTATGAGALLSNTTGFTNTAYGAFALFRNIDGSSNNAVGDSALFENIHGIGNTAVGDMALSSNDMTGDGSGNLNTAVGMAALSANTDGSSNTAVGVEALTSNIFGLFNVAFGADALQRNSDGGANLAIGVSALSSNVHGSFNTVVGHAAGATVEGHDNIYIGATAANTVTTESATIRIGNPQFLSACFIAGIFGQPTASGVPVLIDANGKLGTSMSSARFKHGIKPMDNASESIFSLKPVTYRYKKEFDSEGIPQFGLVAEEVEKVNPDLVVRDKEGKPYSVRYDQVNAMLLNEFLKEHHQLQDLKAIVARQQKQIEALTAGLQKVSAQCEAGRPTPQVVLNNQ